MGTAMSDNNLRVEDSPRRDDVAFLHARLYEANAAATGVDDGRWLTFFVRDASGTISAGLHGWTWGGTGFVEALWVADHLRRRGLGSRLLLAAEAEARRRGCHEMQLDTHSYQAPGFYERQGYEVIGQLRGWPGNGTRIFLRKLLTGGPS
jgi:ribosomal protein S18 acetylase RimI-like enzyme